MSITLSRPSAQKLANDAVRDLHVEILGVENGRLVVRRTKEATGDAGELVQKIFERLSAPDASDEIRTALQDVSGIELL